MFETIYVNFVLCESFACVIKLGDFLPDIWDEMQAIKIVKLAYDLVSRENHFCKEQLKLSVRR